MKKAENPSQYAKRANEGLILLHPVKINGEEARSDNGVGYHSTIKEFDTNKDHAHKIHDLAQHLPLNPPDAKNTQIEPNQFKDRDGNDVFVITLKGNSADKMKEHHGKFASMGIPEQREWNPHISVPKDMHDKIKSSGAKTAHEAGIEFGDAELKIGPKRLKTYRHAPDSAEPVVPDLSDYTAKVDVNKAENSLKPLMKPYVSESQRRWAHTPSGEEALGGKSGVHEWDEATKGKKLPEKVSKSKPLEKGALKNAGIALGMGAALAGASNHTSNIKNPPDMQAQHQSQYDHAKMLRAIADVESSGGKNTNHKPTPQGTAYGRYALMPNTITDTIKGHKDLKAKYGKALSLKGPQLHRFMQDNKGLEDVIADRHLAHIEHNFKNNPDKTAFSWNQGITGAKKADENSISSHPYVKKIRDAYGKEK